MTISSLSGDATSPTAYSARDLRRWMNVLPLVSGELAELSWQALN